MQASASPVKTHQPIVNPVAVAPSEPARKLIPQNFSASVAELYRNPTGVSSLGFTFKDLGIVALQVKTENGKSVSVNGKSVRIASEADVNLFVSHLYQAQQATTLEAARAQIDLAFAVAKRAGIINNGKVNLDILNSKKPAATVAAQAAPSIPSPTPNTQVQAVVPTSVQPPQPTAPQVPVQTLASRIWQHCLSQNQGKCDEKKMEVSGVHVFIEDNFPTQDAAMKGKIKDFIYGYHHQQIADGYPNAVDGKLAFYFPAKYDVQAFIDQTRAAEAAAK